jgi:hypothetical protein
VVPVSVLTSALSFEFQVFRSAYSPPPLGLLDPFNEQVGEATSCPLQGSDQVEPLNSERPCDGNSL